MNEGSKPAAATSRGARVLEAVGLAGPAYRLRRRLQLARLPAEEPTESGGFPVPPPELRFLVGHTADLPAFIEGGRQVAEMIGRRLEAHGRELDSLESILDFGCGCGRVARHWAPLQGPQIHGADYNPELAGWCEANLPFMSAVASGLEPPLPYPDDSLDLIYAISVFTHLPLALQESWMAELRRVLRPGGILLITISGDSLAAEHLTGEERALYARGEPVVRLGALAGTNGCATWHPPAYAREQLLAGLEVVDFEPTIPEVGQDVYVARAAEP